MAKENEETPSSLPERIIDMESLKALAHPLRVTILDTLSTYGAFTASGLAERLGESSGATSYHLRQLEKHRFVREVEGRGSGRERWWERVPGGISLSASEFSSESASRSASRLILREWMHNRNRVLDDFLDHGDVELSKDWMEASTVSLSNLVLTMEQTDDLTKRLMAVVTEFADTYRGQHVTGARPVQAHVNVFPVLDGVEISEEDPT
jgi:DNA-binding transcriptional ArsR family regulator